MVIVCVTDLFTFCFCKMNITEKQKKIMVNFMRLHADFGRGRLRYNRDNKKKMDELWEELAGDLNCSGSGPQKLPKEWAKTWRDWKSNLFKRVAAHKNYAAGGTPRSLNTTPSEDDLLDFLTPEAIGMLNIPKGGVFGYNKYTFSPRKPTRDSIDNLNIQHQILQLKKEKMALAKELFEFKKKAHAESIELQKLLIKELKELTSIVKSIAPEYLE